MIDAAKEPRLQSIEETGMDRNTRLRIARALAAASLAIGVSGVAAANRGGGDSGDSSMNPFTGDSYAYFHGGHNLGEQGTIFPDHRYRTAPRKAEDAKAARAPASGPTPDTAVPPTIPGDVPQNPARR
jgi:hypothetical protein